MLDDVNLLYSGIVELDEGYLTGELVDTITDPQHLDGVASGAIIGRYLYVNNARYTTFPDPTTSYSLTRIRIRP